MLTLPSSLRVFAKTGPTDMRKSFEGLVEVVERELGQQVESGDLFLFFNRRGDRVKVLWFAGDGLVIWYKKHKSHYPHFLLFTEIGRNGDNLASRPAPAVGMDAGPPSFGPRRRPMPGEITVICSPPRRVCRGPVSLDQLWSRLTEDQRQQTLATLSGIVVRQLVVPFDEREVHHERS